MSIRPAAAATWSATAPSERVALLELDLDGRVRASIERVPYDASAVAREVAAVGLPLEYAAKLVAAA